MILRIRILKDWNDKNLIYLYEDSEDYTQSVFKHQKRLGRSNILMK